MKLRLYLRNVFLIIPDLALNAITGGSPFETVSSRAGKYVRTGKGWFPCKLCKLLNLFDQNHCIRSIQEEEYLDKIDGDN